LFNQLFWSSFQHRSDRRKLEGHLVVDGRVHRFELPPETFAAKTVQLVRVGLVLLFIEFDQKQFQVLTLLPQVFPYLNKVNELSVTVDKRVDTFQLEDQLRRVTFNLSQLTLVKLCVHHLNQLIRCRKQRDVRQSNSTVCYYLL